jgi:hypothetical protein
MARRGRKWPLVACVLLLFSGILGCSATQKFEMSEETKQVIRHEQAFAAFWETYQLQVKREQAQKRQIRKDRAEAEAKSAAEAAAKRKAKIEAEAKVKAEEAARLKAAAETATIQAEKDARSTVETSSRQGIAQSPPRVEETPPPATNGSGTPSTSQGQGVDLNGNGWNDDFDRMVEEGKKTDERGGGDGYWN